MARLNIFSINNHVATRFNKPLLVEEGAIANSFLLNHQAKNVSQNHVYSTTVRFMPVAKLFNFEELPKASREEITMNSGAPEKIKDLEQMSTTLKSLFTEIQAFRNDYSHYASTEEGFERKTTIAPQTAHFLKSAFRYAIEYTKVRMKDVLREEDYSLVAEKTMVSDDGTITTEGLVFLICMFLEREQAFQFVGKVKGLKGTQYSTFIATREVLMAYCVKLPHDKFISEDRRQSLTLNMINELNRCPKTLYNVITEEGKKHFRPELDINHRQNLIDNSVNPGEAEEWDEPTYEEYITELTRRVRHTHRFPYFAMRFIDEMNAFSTLRFHFHLGKVELANYPKQLAGEEEPRRIVENVKAFGKWDEFQEKEAVMKRVDPRGAVGSFEQFAPYYSADNNKIGLSTKNRTAVIVPKSGEAGHIRNKLNQPPPEAFLSVHELPKIILLEYLQPGKAASIIMDYIHVNRHKLFDKEFIEAIKLKLPSEWDEFKKRADAKKSSAYTEGKLGYLRSRKAELDHLLSEHGLNAKQVPTRIVNYWLNIVEVDERRSFSDRVKLMRSDCKDRLKALKKHADDPKARIPKVGEMATYLAKDIVNMMVDKGKKQKITSFYYDKMQECLAFYADADKKEVFHQVLLEIGALESGGHPFLSRVMQRTPRYTAQFYEYYLQEKEKKIEIFYTTAWDKDKRKRMTTVRMPTNTSTIPYTIRRWAQEESSNLDEWLENVTKVNKKAVDLPTNLFDAHLVSLLEEKLSQAGVHHPPGLNYNQLLKIWWHQRGDTTQEFYRFEREYNIYNEKINFSPDTQPTFHAYYQEAFRKVNKAHAGTRKPVGVELEKIFKSEIAGTEKAIRKLQEEDRVMLLMIEKMLHHADGEEVKNVELGKVDQLLNETVPVKLPLNYNARGMLITDGSHPVLSRTIINRSKRKNYTELRKYRYDRRLPGLLAYHPGEEVELEWLKRQLSSYDKAKQAIFDTVFDLEKHIMQMDAGGILSLFTDDAGNPKSGNIQHKPYLKWLQNQELVTDTEEQFLSQVRNAFSHNQFPVVASVLEQSPHEDELAVAEQISTLYQHKVTAIITQLIREEVET